MSSKSHRETAGAVVAGVWVALALCVLAALAYGFSRSFFGDAAGNVAVVAKPAPQLAKIEPEFIVLTQPVKAYRPKAKAALALPAPVQATETAVVLAASRIAPADRPQTVTAVLDTRTGETTQYVVDEPLPWLDTTARAEAGVYLGLKRGAPTIRVQARAQLMQVKALRLGAMASADLPLNGAGSADAFIGVGAWMQF